MARAFDPKAWALGLLAAERGTLHKDAPEAVALLYPSPYTVAMSSLGYQTMYRRMNAMPGRAAHRAFLPDDVAGFRASRTPLFTFEAMRPVADYRIVAFSVAYEMEIAGLIECLRLADIPPLAEDRDERHPFILAGGPLTFSNPLPLAPYVDAVLMGEAEDTVAPALSIVFGSRRRDEALAELARAIPSAFVPSLHGDAMPPVEKANDAELPARSQIVTPNTELRDMFLIEPERGCHRGCAYCVMRRSTNGGMRTVDKDNLLSLIPDDVRKVGLVGAATTDHPQIAEIMEAIVASGREVGLSSLRADRLNDRFVAALRAGGHKVLTTASDGASQRLRDFIQRKNRTEVLFRVAELARKHRMKRVKLYMMLGIPTETEDDIDELVDFSLRFSKIIPLSLGIAPFVAKRNTPLDGTPFAGIDVVERRLARLRAGVKGRVEIRPTSARWAWVEYVLAQGGAPEGRAVLDAVDAGGRFRDYERAFEALPEDRPRRAVVRPGDRLGRAGEASVPRLRVVD
jgi:radical SAM superfamily enzyme YgiQ (UPF0313 family)